MATPKLSSLRSGRERRHTVRLRLTLLYGSLFLLAGVALLAITYTLVVRATDSASGNIVSGLFSTFSGPAAEGSSGSSGLPGAAVPDSGSGPVTIIGPSGSVDTTSGPSLTSPVPAGLTASQRQAFGGQMVQIVQYQHADLLHQFLVQCGIALAITAALSIALGYLAAGRILRPVRTIVETTRRISGRSLHARLNLDGPNDEIKELGDTIDALLGRLEAAFQAQSQFIANASHELRSPLARQRLLSQVALADPEASVESLRAAHERVIASGEQQHRLIESLLALARGQAGLSTRTQVDLAELVSAALAARREEAARLGLRVEADLGPAAIEGSAALAEGLVGNLLDNALRHNAADGRISVCTETEQGRAVLTVANTGPVIPAADVLRLTRPFQRLGASRVGPRRAADGLGLGLSIVEAVAHAHGAALDLRPRLEGGLTVRVRFPARAAEQAASSPPVSAGGLRIGP